MFTSIIIIGFIFFLIVIAIIIIGAVLDSKKGSAFAGEYYQTEKVTGTFRFNSKIAGVTYETKGEVSRQKLIKQLKKGDILYLIPDRHNKHDANAIAVFNNDEEDLGYLPSQTAADLKPELEAGKKFFAQVEEITGKGLFQSKGVNIAVFEVDYSSN